MNEQKSVLQVITQYYEEMFVAEKKVAKFILDNPRQCVTTNISELAELSGASDATVIRMCKRIGFEGYSQMKIRLSNDLGKEQVFEFGYENKEVDSIGDVFQMMIGSLIHMYRKFDMENVLKCVELIRKSSIVYIVAAGNTIPIAMDLAFRLNKCGIRAMSSSIYDYNVNAINLAKSDDLVIGISRSGSSKNVIQSLELARERQVMTIGIVNTAKSPIAYVADYTLCTSVENKMFDNDGLTSHLFEMAIFDMLLYFVEHLNKKSNGEIDKVELLLSEYKL